MTQTSTQTPPLQTLQNIKYLVGDGFVLLRPIYVKICEGDFKAAILLSYILGWFDFDTGWVHGSPGRHYTYKRSTQIQEHTGLDRKQQWRAGKKLIKFGFIAKVPNHIMHNVNFHIEAENWLNIEEAILKTLKK